MAENFLLNISTGTIHDATCSCPNSKRMAEKNKKLFDKYEDAVNFYTGTKKGNPCGICLKNKEQE